MIDAIDIHVKGVVQGVGFRPFVYRLAKHYLINGWVMNATDGVHIHAEGESDLVDQFVLAISDDAPAAARVSEIDIKEVPLEPFDSFEIRFSDENDVEETTQVSPDLAVCDDCKRELFDRRDCRYRYPFINCTNCGPRFTIIDKLPYDRANTSMCDFEMCSECASEYENPADRRFHAQPDACFECGPKVWLVECGDAGEQDGGAGEQAEDACAQQGDSCDRSGEAGYQWGENREQSDGIFARVVQLLLDGKIVAIKGLGGYHLACDAHNAEAVAKLRERKHRDGKPFAVMMNCLDDVRSVCEVSDEEAAVLSGSSRPIVLLKKLRKSWGEFPGVADDLPELGVMLPYTPVQMLLLHDFDEAQRKTSQPFERSSSFPPMLVMTSGNVHDDPIAIDDEDALGRLSGIADAFLGNNRRILTRFDDSIVRVIEAGNAGPAIQMIRRARGYAPEAISVKMSNTKASTSNGGASDSALAVNTINETCVFATGPEQKNTFTFLRNAESGSGETQAQAFVSQHIGDMENADTFEAWLTTKQRFEDLFDLEVRELACDMHPEYITSKWAHERAALSGRAHEKAALSGRAYEKGAPGDNAHERAASENHVSEETGFKQLSLTEVQHHHAHIASAMAENALDQAVCGIAFDGTGYGADGNIWGGEVLISNLQDYERFANFAYVPMPGGAAAIKHPLQMAYGVLWEFDLLDHPGAQIALKSLSEAQKQTFETMIEEGINTPVTSSVGRLFDAASALLGICTEPTYEGEPAIMLEAELSAPTYVAASTTPYTIDIVKNTATETSTAHDTSVILLDAAPAFKGLLDDLSHNVDKGIIAKRFHDAFIGAIVQAAQLSLALYEISIVVLSGGVFMNRYLLEGALEALEQAGFTVAINRDLPPNDGCVSFGEAVVTYAKTINVLEA